MSSSHAGLEALILGIPAVGMLFTSFFRLDEMLANRRIHFEPGHPLSHRTEDGEFVCIEPDGRYSVGVVKGSGRGLAQRRAGHFPRRCGSGAVRRVSVEWVEDGSGE